jgi:hypothetical protein
MKKHLTFKDDKSDKFWNIEVNGKTFYNEILPKPLTNDFE